MRRFGLRRVAPNSSLSTVDKEKNGFSLPTGSEPQETSVGIRYPAALRVAHVTPPHATHVRSCHRRRGPERCVVVPGAGTDDHEPRRITDRAAEHMPQPARAACLVRPWARLCATSASHT
jgi:hypothetical protein